MCELNENDEALEDSCYHRPICVCVKSGCVDERVVYMDDAMSVCSDHLGLYPGIQWESGYILV